MRIVITVVNTLLRYNTTGNSMLHIKLKCFIDKPESKLSFKSLNLLVLSPQKTKISELSKPNVITNHPTGRLYPNNVEATGHYKHCEQ